eukprot:12726224-Alexandrium_andersonii.AAC.1
MEFWLLPRAQHLERQIVDLGILLASPPLGFVPLAQLSPNALHRHFLDLSTSVGSGDIPHVRLDHHPETVRAEVLGHAQIDDM